MIPIIAIFLATCFLAYANGANDNFKGVATLFGSGTISYRKALWWATFTTVAGSLCSIFVAQLLIERFSGKGLLPDEVVGAPEFMVAVAAGAGITVILAVARGFPISTTHALTGALLGAGLMAAGQAVNFNVLGGKVFLPLLVSPLIALMLGGSLYCLFRRIRLLTGFTKEWCLCIGDEEKILPISEDGLSMSFANPAAPAVAIGSTQNCSLRYRGKFLGIRLQNIVDSLHVASGGLVCFARGLNDTPKIVALLLAANALNLELSLLAVAAAMAAGGLIHARRIADTMGRRITSMSHGQGFSANLVTAFLVIFASRWGVPVSTTHVSVGSLFGIGLLTGNGDKSVMSGIVLAWILTLPAAALFSGACYWLIGVI